MEEKGATVSLIASSNGRLNQIFFTEQFVSTYGLEEMLFVNWIWYEEKGCLKITFYPTDDTEGFLMLRVHMLGRRGERRLISVGRILNKMGIAVRTGKPIILMCEKCEGEDNSFLIFFPPQIRLASLAEKILEKAGIRAGISGKDGNFPILPPLSDLVRELSKDFPGVSVNDIREALSFAARRLVQSNK